MPARRGENTPGGLDGERSDAMRCGKDSTGEAGNATENTSRKVGGATTLEVAWNG